MVKTDSRVSEYIEGAPEFARPILTKIRADFHAGCSELVEDIKWGVPSFEHNGLLGGMAYFKKHVSFGFWRAPEMEDPHGLLGEERKASPMRIKAESVRDLPSKKVLVSYVKQAAKLNRESPKSAAKKPKSTGPKPPAWMVKAIKENADAGDFWKGLAPGYRKEYVEWVTEAKREATREKRLAQTVEWLAEGKTRNWKYKNC